MSSVDCPCWRRQCAANRWSIVYALILKLAHARTPDVIGSRTKKMLDGVGVNGVGARTNEKHDCLICAGLNGRWSCGAVTR